MIHFLIGFYFGGALATLLALIGGALVHEQARDKMLADPIYIIFIILFWPIAIPKSIYDAMR